MMMQAIVLKTIILLAWKSTVSASELQKPILSEPWGEGSASLVLYPGSRIHPEDLKHLNKEIPACPDDSETAAIQLALNTCLSGEYYLQDNFKITEMPSCKDGSVPNISLYPRRSCTGRPSLTKEAPVNTCLWTKDEISNPSYYWSMAFHCGEPRLGEDMPHQTATPAITHQIEGGLKGKVEFITMGVCGRDTMPSSWGWNKPNDDCTWPVSSSPFTAIKIRGPPICANGTRARLARMQDTGEGDRWYRCNGGRNTFKDGLVDIHDEDIGNCISVRNMELTQGGTSNAKGVMFYCDGLDLSRERQTSQDGLQTPDAVVSHNECQPSSRYGKPPSRATTFMNVPAGVCVDLPRGQPLRLHKNAVCEDGSEALMATWGSPGCHGLPDKVAGVSSGVGSICKSFSDRGDASYAFWCGGNGRGESDGRAVYSSDECESKDGWYTPEQNAGLAPTIARVEADKCLTYFSANSDWVVHQNAICANGRPAKMAFWSGVSGCRGRPDSIKEIKKADEGKCVEACGTKEGDRWHKCSRAFWCDGVRR